MKYFPLHQTCNFRLTALVLLLSNMVCIGFLPKITTKKGFHYPSNKRQFQASQLQVKDIQQMGQDGINMKVVNSKFILK